MRSFSIPLGLALAVLTLAPPTAHGDTLEELIGPPPPPAGIGIYRRMPRKDTDGFVVPRGPARIAWRNIVGQMLTESLRGGNFSDLDLPPLLRRIYKLSEFEDDENGRTYWVLMEALDAGDDNIVDRGWGTFIVYPKAVRELCIQVPHPRADSDTAAQGISIFKGTSSRSFLMAGANRKATTNVESCQGSGPGMSDWRESDVAHNVDNLFHQTVVELETVYEANTRNFVVLQFHTMRDIVCPANVYMTYGSSATPPADSALVRLQSELRNNNVNTWVISVPGDETCSLNGTRNVQGRLLNYSDDEIGVLDICLDNISANASDVSRRFIHIEQDPDEPPPREFHNPDNWIQAIKDTWIW